ncbi:MAG: CPBP family intramembrane metalloprotease [Deltaproteobacteria bacterium]|nr:CPBP family intramembrane metalloprotease [Deltaproteobacteria bacterium]
MRRDERPQRIVWQALGVSLVFALLTRLLLLVPWLRDYRALLFTLLGVYLPLWLLQRSGRPVDFLESDGASLRRALTVFLIVAAIVFPLYLVAAHGWQTSVVGLQWRSFIAPSWTDVVTQLVFVALPEEFFFRGYLQSTLDRVFRVPWRICGVRLGWAWILTAVIFAAAHSVVHLAWWHFAILFPGLLFGYLRARTGGLVAPILFHAACNIVAQVVGMSYGR